MCPFRSPDLMCQNVLKGPLPLALGRFNETLPLRYFAGGLNLFTTLNDLDEHRASETEKLAGAVLYKRVR